MQERSEMSLTQTFAIGERLEIGYGDDVVSWLASRVEDHLGPDRLTVAWPTDAERRLVPLETGQAIELAASAHHDALYSASVTVEQTTRDPVPLLTVRLVGPWRRVQRRDAVRASVAIKPRIADRIDGQNSKPLRLGITDISCAGLQVRAQEELKLGDRLEL